MSAYKYSRKLGKYKEPVKESFRKIKELYSAPIEDTQEGFSEIEYGTDIPFEMIYNKSSDYNNQYEKGDKKKENENEKKNENENDNEKEEKFSFVDLGTSLDDEFIGKNIIHDIRKIGGKLSKKNKRTKRTKRTKQTKKAKSYKRNKRTRKYRKK